MRINIKHQLMMSQYELQKTASFWGCPDGISGYDILIREAWHNGLRGFDHDGNPEGSNKAIRRWNNGGYQIAIKKIASRLVASGAARKPFQYWDDMHLAMCHDARFYAKAKRIE